MLRENVKKLDAVLFTHSHKDHIAGLDDVKAYTFFSGKPMQVFANELTQIALKREFMYVFASQKYPGIPEIDLHTIEDAPFNIGDIPIVPILVWHFKMPVLGFRIGKFTYITDANKIDEQQKEKIKGSETLVLNALRKAAHISHYTLDEAISLVQELEIPQAYFTHISHQLGLYDSVTQELPNGIQLAYDGLKLHF
jgi:phosphoribosyl 1,2-cyclic phosphate phosphodiesterase